MEKICKSCGCLFTPVASVPKQKFCHKKKCQKIRRSLWQRNKRATDKAYRENQKDAQKAWQKKNKDYWQKYRKRNIKYTELNRKQQRVRNEKRKMLRRLPDIVKSEIAKMDALKRKNSVISGYYKLAPIEGGKIANMDVMVVKIDVIACSYNELFKFS